MNLRQFCRVKYGLPEGAEPTKAQLNTVTQMCRDGKLDAIKVGRQWLVNLQFESEKGKK